jgi:hypothetical protein
VNFLEWGLEALIILAIAATLPQAIRLERALSALKQDRGTLAESARAFAAATKEAETAIARLRAAADGAGRSIGEQVRIASELREDLRFLSERAAGLADRLDAGLRSTRGPAPTEAARPAVPRARAEASLMKALRGGRDA